MTTPCRPKEIIIDCEPWPPIFTAENVRSVKTMVPRSDDIFICTYPKCGTTWVQHIVHQLIERCEYENESDINGNMDEEKTPTKAMHNISPMIEEFGAVFCDAIASPRILKTHLRYENTPKGGGAKYIYIVRNPKDVATSYFYHHHNFKCYEYESGTFDKFFDLFMNGELGHGDYFNHLESWLEGIDRKEEKILFLKYEEMVSDLHSSVVRIGNFLGGLATENVEQKETLERIVENSTISAMKVNQDRWCPNIYHRGNFIRKGGSRNWKNLLNKEQSEILDKRFNQRCGGTVAADWWSSEMAWDDYTTCPSFGNVDIALA